MELIISLCAAIGAFIGTVAAHFVAHDAYSQCPRYARRLIERAAKNLPPLERLRYAEEWVADLEERDGVFAKFKHAFECLLCARTLRRIAERKPQTLPSMQFEAAGAGLLEVDLKSGLQAIAVIGRVWVREAVEQGELSEDQATECHAAFNELFTGLGAPNKSDILRLADFIEMLPTPCTLLCRLNSGVRLHQLNIPVSPDAKLSLLDPNLLRRAAERLRDA
jgi:hypothetical protein